MNKNILLLFATVTAHASSATACGCEPSFERYTYESPFIYDLPYAVNSAAEQFLAKNSQFTLQTLPWQFSAEYAQHKDEALAHLYKSTHNGVFHVTRYDVNRAITRYFEPFCQKLKEVIIKEQLSTVIHKKIRHVLRQHGFASESSLPVRFAQEFNEKIAMIKARAQSHIAENAKTYLREAELDKIVQQEFDGFFSQVNSYLLGSSFTTAISSYNSYAPVASPAPTTALPSGTTIAVAALKDEICAICLDGYKVGERTGLLSCNHLYHKDCIYTWLNTSKSCPLCRAQNVIVSQQKTVC